jgi:hypothetical protein
LFDLTVYTLAALAAFVIDRDRAIIDEPTAPKRLP